MDAAVWVVLALVVLAAVALVAVMRKRRTGRVLITRPGASSTHEAREP